MSVSIRLAAVLAVGIALALAASGAWADISWDFESGLGHNAEDIGSFSGLTFDPVFGRVLFSDINSGWYSVTSDNGKVFEDGQYFVSGDVAAYVANPHDQAKISFDYGTASYFTVGYSSQFEFTVEAYDSNGQFLDDVTGAANVKSLGGTGVDYLTVSCPGIAYVVLHDQGGFWVIDNVETDAPATIPEPGSGLALAVGLVGFALRRRGSR